MTKTRSWTVENLDCASCANELEQVLSLHDGVASASMNYLSKKLTVESKSDESDSFWLEVEHTAKRAEPTVTLLPIRDGESERVYSFSGLDCAACALEVEEILAKGAGVASAQVDWAGQTIRIKSQEAQGDHFFDALIDAAKKTEPTLTVSAQKKVVERSPFLQARLYRIIASLLSFALAMALDIPSLYLASYLIAGWDVIYKAARNILGGKIFDEYFLMTVATVGALFIGERGEAAAVMLFYLIGEYFQQSAVIQSRRSVLAALALKVEETRLVDGDAVTLVKSEQVPVGSLIRVLAGEKVPLDGIIERGVGELDMQSLTGESLPQYKGPGDEVLSSSLNLSSTLDIRTTRAFEDSTATKILHLVEESSAKKAESERFITTFARYYTPAVVALALALAIIPSLITGAWQTWIYRALVFLVVSCPCALVISVPLSYFAGIGKSAKSGVIVKGGNSLETLRSLDAVVFDKTRTLTSGRFVIDSTAVDPSSPYDEATLTALAASLEQMSRHPLSEAFASIHTSLAASDVTEIAGKGMVGTVDGKRIAAGNAALFAELDIAISPTLGAGGTILLAVDGVHAAAFTLLDEAKGEAKEVLATLKEQGVRHLVMISGDNEQNARRVASAVGIDEVHASLLPHEKQEEVLRLSQQYPNLAFVGDGINDAPSLAVAKVGISVGSGASDLAIESADVVILSEDLTRVATLVEVARKTGKIVRQNITFALVVKALALLFGALGYASMWVAVIADTGVTIVAVLNALRILLMRPAR